MFEVEIDGNNVYTKDRLKCGFERVVLTLKGWKIPQLPFSLRSVATLRLLSRYRHDRPRDKSILPLYSNRFRFFRNNYFLSYVGG